MKRITIVLGIVIIFLIALKTWGFSFGGLGIGTVPVTDSQLKAVNSALDAIETTLTEELKNININLYNLLRLQYESFFKENYQNKILQMWDLQDRFDDYQTLLKDLSDIDNQNEKLYKYIENAEFVGAYQTLNELPNLISCLPEDNRFLAEEYISSTFAYYKLSQYGLSQLSLIPSCEEIYPDFGANITSQKPIYQPKGFLSGLFANILKPFSLGNNFMLAEGPIVAPPLATISIVSGYPETRKSIIMDSFYSSVDSSLDINVKKNLENIPDTRNVVVPVKQVKTDDGKSIILDYRTLVDFDKIYEAQQNLMAFFNQSNFTDFDWNQAFATETFATGTKSIPGICKKLTIGDAKPFNPQVACAEAIANFSVDLKKAVEEKSNSKRGLLDIIRGELEDTQQKINNLENSPTTTECQGYQERLAELKKFTSSSLVHVATLTIDVNKVINQLTGIDINQHIQQISSTRATLNKEYRDILKNVNNILTTFKAKTIKVTDLLRPLNLDFIESILKDLEGHNALLSLNKIDEVMQNVDNIFKSAGNIASALGQSREIFDNFRSSLRNAVKPISNSVLVKDYFEIYGIQVEVAKMEEDIQNGCRNQVARRNQQRFYSLKGNNNYFSLSNFQKSNHLVVKKIQPREEQKKLIKDKGFFQKLMAKIFSSKVVEINLR